MLVKTSLGTEREPKSPGWFRKALADNLTLAKQLIIIVRVLFPPLQQIIHQNKLSHIIRVIIVIWITPGTVGDSERGKGREIRLFSFEYLILNQRTDYSSTNTNHPHV